MKLATATETLAILRDVFIPRLLLADKHYRELDEAINLGISAIKTIEDGNFMLKPAFQFQPQIDLKTLYEQTTPYCDLVDIDNTADYYVEIFHQLETPIYIFVYWNREPRTIQSIAYQIK